MPALAELHAWLLATQRAVAAGSGTSKAIEHVLKRWPALELYAGSGALPINNPVANAVRPIAFDKKNWLFRGSTGGGAIAPLPFGAWSPPLSSTGRSGVLVGECTRTSPDMLQQPDRCSAAAP